MYLAALRTLLDILFSCVLFIFFFSSRRRHTRLQGDWSSDVCSSDLELELSPRRPALRLNRGTAPAPERGQVEARSPPRPGPRRSLLGGRRRARPPRHGRRGSPTWQPRCRSSGPPPAGDGFARTPGPSPRRAL